MDNNYCTYLNSGLLRAPREYVLHGLVPGLDWASFWPHSLWACILLPRPTRYLAVYCNGSSFIPPPSSIWGLLTNVQVNIIIILQDTRHTCIYITLVQLFVFFFLYIFHFPGQAGCPPLALSDTVMLWGYCIWVLLLNIFQWVTSSAIDRRVYCCMVLSVGSTLLQLTHYLRGKYIPMPFFA
jgi:hypothetical protein